MADKKYLDNVGLGHMWNKVKSYLGNNYPTKSELTNGLAGKANSSHTHTVSQITDLSSGGYLKVNKSLGTTSFSSGYRVNIPNNIVNQLTFVLGGNHSTESDWNIYLPSGGTYLVYCVNGGTLSAFITCNKYSGGSSIGKSRSYTNGFIIVRIS